MKCDKTGTSHKRLSLQFLAAILIACCFGSRALAADLMKGSISSAHGSPDYFGLAVPHEKERSGLLLVYLHGAGHDFTEPFLKTDSASICDSLLQSSPGAILLSPNCGGSSWGNDAALADLNAAIRRVATDYKTRKIVLIGNSMGASVVLSYAACASPDIQAQLVGIIAAQPASDLSALYRMTAQSELPSTLSAAFGGTPNDRPDVYQRKSVTSNMANIPSWCKVVLITAEKDVVIPYSLQLEVSKLLASSRILHKVITRNVAHGCHSTADLIDGLQFINGAEQKTIAKDASIPGWD